MGMDNGWDGVDWEIECERLQCELSRIALQLDAAIADIKKLMINSSDVSVCQFCDNHECGHGDGCMPVWRGVQAEQ